MLSGGKFYGEGAKGRVEDTRCIFKDTKTFCKYINDVLSSIEKITLYHTLSSKVTLSKKIDIMHVIGLLGKNDITLTKTYKQGSIDVKEEFTRELQANTEISKHLKPMYHTLKPAFVYKSLPVNGVCMMYTVESGLTPTYHLFTEACSTQPTDFKFTQTTFNKFVKEIKECLDSLHAAGWNHNDIKPDNMIYCARSNRFKVVDWGMSSSHKTKPFAFNETGTKYYNHPLMFYLAGIPAFVSRRLMAYSLLVGKHTWTKKLKTQDIVQSLSTSSFDYILSRYSKLNSKELHAKFAPHYDNYAFAITLLLLADKNNVKAPKDIVDKLLEPFMPSTV